MEVSDDLRKVNITINLLYGKIVDTTLLRERKT